MWLLQEDGCDGDKVEGGEDGALFSRRLLRYTAALYPLSVCAFSELITLY